MVKSGVLDADVPIEQLTGDEEINAEDGEVTIAARGCPPQSNLRARKLLGTI